MLRAIIFLILSFGVFMWGVQILNVREHPGGLILVFAGIVFIKDSVLLTVREFKS